ncbi:MAG TPA: hypothetical protein VJ802_00930 [Gemmatimonadaceae bacterium]|nr:hypothetical protein [Gemmatimonadaceae bacterium]
MRFSSILLIPAVAVFSGTAAAQDTTRAPRPDSTTADTATAAATTPAAVKKPVAARPSKPAPVWPVKGPMPLPGSILPHSRIVAFYGNPLSKRMGILGALPPERMLAKLDTVVAEWRAADSLTVVQPALHFIAVVAQAAPGRDGKYRARMADTLIDRVLSWAETRNAIVFLDLQVGKSTLQDELPRLAKYLSLPNVHLGIDPEFSMKRGGRPGERVGTYDATDINYATAFLADLVTQHNLPPKVFVVHRFTRPMVTNTGKITLDPRVQIVMHMDGWGWPSLKKESYRRYIYQEPVQFTGFKLFYRNDTKAGHPLMTPSEVLKLEPKPVYIQYQ